MRYLDKISDPADLQQFSERELTLLADEVRETILSCVSETGGHLAASLGTVELTVALHSVLREPARQDRLGRRPPVLRAQAAHGTPRPLRDHPPVRRPLRLPAAARSRRTTSSAPATPRRRSATGSASSRPSASPGTSDGNVVCVLGDGALTGGVAFEALNQAGHLRTPLVVDHQRQRDVDPRQRRRPAALPQPHPSRPDAHAPARGPRARRRARSRPSAARRTGWARTSRSR